jgi:hypothetical protein
VGARRRVTLRPADLPDGPMRDREVDLSSCNARFGGVEPESSEQGLRDPVMALVFGEGLSPTDRESGLPSAPSNQAHLLKSREMVERRGRPDPEGCGDGLEGDSAFRSLPGSDRLEGIDLTPGELL